MQSTVGAGSPVKVTFNLAGKGIGFGCKCMICWVMWYLITYYPIRLNQTYTIDYPEEIQREFT